MDKIYSRRRIKLPKVVSFKAFRERKIKFNNKIILIIIVVLIAFSVTKFSIEHINPMFDSLCSLKAKGVATKIVNREANASLANVDYNDLITIVRDSNGEIKLVKANVIAINTIATELNLGVQKALEDETETIINIPAGSFLGNQILYNVGPKIPIRLTSSGIVKTDFKSEFTNSGINQTIHRIYLYTTCKFNIITPIKTISNEVNNEILVAETVIVGPIPDSYYNLEGLEKTDAMEVVD